MIREIRPCDKQRVLEISLQIWEGDDYIPHVFDEWVQDNGVFAGLWENDILVGFGKLTWLTPRDVWLEGLRKDEKSGAKRVGEKLTPFYFDHLKGKRIDSIRFSTYFGNKASIKFNEKLGFRKVLELSLKSRNIDSTCGEISDKLTSEIEFKTLKYAIENSEYLKASQGNISKGWIMHHYTEKLLREFYDQRNFIVWQENGRIEGCALWSNVHDRSVFWLSLLETSNEIMFADFLNYFFRLMAQKGKKEIEMLVPTRQLLGYCRKFDFTSWEQENDFFLYEMPPEKIAEITKNLC